MYSNNSNYILINVVPEYQDAQSSPFDNYHVWSYNIQIQNKSSRRVQILNRSWTVIDNSGKTQNIKGEGVVGVQPKIHPGKEFNYSSVVHLEAPSGIMMGTYEVVTEDGEIWNVEIPAFSLDCPHVERVIN